MRAHPARGHGSARRAWPLAIAWLAVLIILAQVPAVALAGSPGVIRGRVVNKTVGGSSVAGDVVVLHIHRLSQNSDDHQQVTLAADGQFRFDGLATGDDFVYEVSAKHAGVEYGSEPLRFESGKTELSVDLAVWETTDRNPGVTVGQVAILILGADRPTQSLQILEVATLKNPADRTFVPRPDGPDGPMGLLRFGLPTGATDLEVAFGLDPDQIIQVDRGFASLMPLPPGEHQVGFAYRVGYDRARLTLDHALALGAGELRVLAPTGGPTITSADLQPLADVTIGAKSYHVLGGRDLKPGSRIAFTLDQLPVRRFWEAPPGQVPVVPILALGVVAIVAGVLLVVGFRRSRTRRAVVIPASAARMMAPAGATDVLAGAGDDREALLNALADLDDRYAQGQIAAAVYERERAALKQRLLAIIRQQPVEGGAP